MGLVFKLHLYIFWSRLFKFRKIIEIWERLFLIFVKNTPSISFIIIIWIKNYNNPIHFCQDLILFEILCLLFCICVTKNYLGGAPWNNRQFDLFLNHFHFQFHFSMPRSFFSKKIEKKRFFSNSRTKWAFLPKSVFFAKSRTKWAFLITEISKIMYLDPSNFNKIPKNEFFFAHHPCDFDFLKTFFFQ